MPDVEIFLSGFFHKAAREGDIVNQKTGAREFMIIGKASVSDQAGHGQPGAGQLVPDPVIVSAVSAEYDPQGYSVVCTIPGKFLFMLRCTLPGDALCRIL